MSLNKVNKNMIDSSYMPSAFVGSIISIFATDTYIPNGCVKPDGVEYTRDQFSSFYDNFLVTGKILTCTYAAHAAQIALSGNCAMFGLDQTNKKFKVPFIKDGDIISHANNTAELGKSYKAGLPNIKGELTAWTQGIYAPIRSDAVTSGPFYKGTATSKSSAGTDPAGCGLGFNAHLANPIYQDAINTVLVEQVRLRHFVVLVSAQNNASTFDWSNYIASLVAKANLDLSNIDVSAKTIIKNTAKPVSLIGTRSTTGSWTITDVTPFVPIQIYLITTATTNDGYSAQIRTQGATGLAISTIDWVLGVSSNITRPVVAILLPNANTVTVNVVQLSAGVTLSAYQ